MTYRILTVIIFGIIKKHSLAQLKAAPIHDRSEALDINPMFISINERIKKMNDKLKLGRYVKIKAYTAIELKELNGRAYDKAYQSFINDIWDGFGSTHVEIIMRERLEELAPSLKDAELTWSLSYSQGDGVAFASQSLTSDMVNDLISEGIAPGYYFNIKQDGRYTHPYSFAVVANTDNEEDEADAQSIAKVLTESLRAIARKLEQVGYNESERITSEEAFLDESNAWIFNQYGEVIADFEEVK
jgi:hypothetical protein